MKKGPFIFRVLVGATLLLAVAILIGVWSGKPDSQFREGGLVTWMSGGLLLWIAWVLNQIRKVRHVAPNRSFFRPATAIWGMMALGFLFLAADEMFALHEAADKLIHRVFGIKEDGFTDRIDDMIVAFYGLAALGMLFAHRSELLRWKAALTWIVVGFVLLFGMVGLDTLTNRDDLLESWLDKPQAKILTTWLSVLEDSLKIYAGTCFLLGWHAVWQRVRMGAEAQARVAAG